MTSAAVRQRIETGRLYPLWRGVYAVGRPSVTREGRWMAAVLACGPGAALSHASAAALWELEPERRGPLHVSAPGFRRRRGIVVHRRAEVEATRQRGIPVTTPLRTVIDRAPRLSDHRLERLVDRADAAGVITVVELRRGVEGLSQAGRLRRVLDRHTFVLTESELERRFLALVRRAGLPLPETQAIVNGFRVDFWWPDLKLVVETDGLRYHRTPAQQARDGVRDQAHAKKDVERLRFTHAQVVFEPDYVIATLTAVAERRAGYE